MARLVLNCGDTEPVKLPLLGDVITIGRAPFNDLVISDPTVSACHASLVRSASGYRLTDLRSTNGTQYNGVRVIEAELKDGDKIRLGDVAAVFREGDTNVFDQTTMSSASVSLKNEAVARKQKKRTWRSYLTLACAASLLALLVSAAITPSKPRMIGKPSDAKYVSGDPKAGIASPSLSADDLRRVTLFDLQLWPSGRLWIDSIFGRIRNDLATPIENVWVRASIYNNVGQLLEVKSFRLRNPRLEPSIPVSFGEQVGFDHLAAGYRWQLEIIGAQYAEKL